MKKANGQTKHLLEEHKAAIREAFHVRQIGIFGSSVSGGRTNASDVDILVEFEAGFKTFDNYMELKFLLENLFKKKVDLVLKSAVKKELKKNILSQAVYV